MPRPLIYSNGRLFVGVDEWGRIRDLTYPHVGLWNHLSGHSIRVGVWVEPGAFRWLEENAWDRELFSEPDGSGGLRARSDGLALELVWLEGVEPGADRFWRRIRVKNVAGEARQVRLFFTHDLRIAESDIGDTAFFHPGLGGIVHYKGPHWFLFTGRAEREGLYEHACGIKGFGDLEGTWRDAEDGRLEGNPIAQGSVDSTFSLRLELGAGGEEEAVYQIVCGDSLRALEGVSAPVWTHLGCAEWELPEELPQDLAGLFRRSAQVLLAHCDRDGAILASVDSDIMATNRANYAYCWPRDGANACLALARLGIEEPGERFFRFCARVRHGDPPVLLQKYRPDGHFGASWHPWVKEGALEVPFQADESALVLHALAVHAEAFPASAVAEELFGDFAAPMADFLASATDEDGLPLPSYDLWEERHGVHAATCAAIFAGLEGAARLAQQLGDGRTDSYWEASRLIRERSLEALYAERAQRFARRSFRSEEGWVQDVTVDAAILWMALLGLADPFDPRFERTMEAIESQLWVSGTVGGLARYEGDYYFRFGEDWPGNPWFLTTLWLAQCHILRARSLEDLDEPLRILRWADLHSGPTRVLAEQVHPGLGTPVSVSPLTWSHAEFLLTAMSWCERKRFFEERASGVGK
jgi:GH15 family glucan-1,4-alpha-glucosidase